MIGVQQRRDRYSGYRQEAFPSSRGTCHLSEHIVLSPCAMRFWLLAHPKNWDPDQCLERIPLKCLHELPDEGTGPGALATCYRIPCCLPESRVSLPTILRKDGGEITELSDMELTGTISISGIKSLADVAGEAAKPKPSVIQSVDDVIRSCRKRQLTCDSSPEVVCVEETSLQRRGEKSCKKVKKERTSVTL